MRSVRVIPCLDIDAGRVVKGTNFVDLTDAGDPVELASFYDAAGADEIVFLDITASSSSRPITLELLARAANEVFIPLTIGGGVRTLNDARQLLRAGADKVSVNSSAISNPSLVSEIAAEFGSQCVVVAIDAKFNGEFYEVYTHGGRNATGIELGSWARISETLGAGELLITSMDRDGTKAGFDLGALKRVAAITSIPIIASGGVGTLEHFYDGAKVEGVTNPATPSVINRSRAPSSVNSESRVQPSTAQTIDP